MSELCLPSPPYVMLLDLVTVFTLLVLGSFLTALATICCYVARRQQRRRQRAAVEADTRCVLSRIPKVQIFQPRVQHNYY